MSTELMEVPQQQVGGELAVSAQQAMARYEIEGALILSRKYPRDEDTAHARLMKACDRWTFAAMSRYSYPRGGTQVEGPSVNLLREAGRCWGNIRYGADIVHDDADTRTIRGWAWDMESNTKSSQDATFKKLIQRKDKNSGVTRWVAPDERDLRELTNKHGAICLRNCLRAVLPADLIDEAMRTAKATMEKDAARDPDEARRRMVKAFLGIGVTVEHLEKFLGHPLAQANPSEIADLRAIWKSVSDGNSTWAEYMKEREPEKPTPPKKGTGATIDDLAAGANQKTANPPTPSEVATVENQDAEPPEPAEKTADAPPTLAERIVALHGAVANLTRAEALKVGDKFMAGLADEVNAGMCSRDDHMKLVNDWLKIKESVGKPQRAVKPT